MASEHDLSPLCEDTAEMHLDDGRENRYERRNRKQTEKGEKFTKEKEKQKQKRRSIKAVSPKTSSNCTTCKEKLESNKQNANCCICSEDLHTSCVENVRGKQYCSGCMCKARWDEIEEMDSPFSTPSRQLQKTTRSPQNSKVDQVTTDLLMMETSIIEEEIFDLNEQLKQLEASDMSPRMLTPTKSYWHQNKVKLSHMPVGTKAVDYKLNMEAALTKKLKACDRAMYKSELKNSCMVITLSTAAFEFFKGEVLSYLQCKPEYAVKEEQVLDQCKNITQDIVRVMKQKEGKDSAEMGPLFTINMYRTTGRIMVNGPSFQQFTDWDLPLIERKIVAAENEICYANDHIRECIKDIATTEPVPKPSHKKANHIVPDIAKGIECIIKSSTVNGEEAGPNADENIDNNCMEKETRDNKTPLPNKIDGSSPSDDKPSLTNESNSNKRTEPSDGTKSTLDYKNEEEKDACPQLAASKKDVLTTEVPEKVEDFVENAGRKVGVPASHLQEKEGGLAASPQDKKQKKITEVTQDLLDKPNKPANSIHFVETTSTVTVDDTFNPLMAKLHDLSGESSEAEISSSDSEAENGDEIPSCNDLSSGDDEKVGDGPITPSTPCAVIAEETITDHSKAPTEETQKVSSYNQQSVDIPELPGTSPKTIPPATEANYYTENKETKEFQCKLCQNTSKTVGGIKNHISRTHKVQKLLICAPKITCCKCKKEVKQAKLTEAGQCVKCKGMEHYRCNVTNKKYINQFKDGSLPFKCTSCCLPGIVAPALDMRSTVMEVTCPDSKAKDEPLDKGDNKLINKKPIDVEVSKNNEILELQKDNVLLTANLKNFIDKDAKTDIKIKLLSEDNYRFTVRIQELQEEISKHQKQESQLTAEKTDLLAKYHATVKELESLRVEHEKAKEVAQGVQTVITKAIREANMLSFEKDKEIERLEKDNEKWKAENRTYKELLSPDASYQRAILHKIQNRKELNHQEKLQETQDIDEPEMRNSISSDASASNSLIINGDIQEIDQDQWSNLDGHIQRASLNDRPDPGSNSRKDNVRYCHFYNRNGCTAPDCQFLHDVAPVCEKFLNGICNRRLCMYRHERSPSVNISDASRNKRVVKSVNNDFISKKDGNVESNFDRNWNLKRSRSDSTGSEDKNRGPDITKFNHEDDRGHIRSKRPRYCHFYNRNGCNNPDCDFLHEIAPACQSFLNGKCTRRLCMFRHKKDFNDGRRTLPDTQIPLHQRWSKNSYQEPRESRELEQDANNNLPLNIRQHRKRYQTSNHADQKLSSYSHQVYSPMTNM